ncbi:hypothetical protein GCM10010261_14170 [Streptomyces pilosus]|nr:hypothetical protein GCM10010261_14170 [Streptomyces pilosus]
MRLDTVAGVPRPRSGCSSSTTSRIVVAKTKRTTEDQRSAIGLVGEVAARAWLQRSNRYRILLITAALVPEERRVFDLPNPFSAQGRDRFRTVSRGVRYQCSPLGRGSASDPQCAAALLHPAHGAS